MAGGEGSRLRPLTCEIPKPLVPVAGEPAIKHIIEHLKSYDVNGICATLYYLPDKIKEYLDKQYKGNIKYYLENKPLGTAGSVKNAKDFIDETFVVMSGDVITDVNIADVYNFHKKNNSKVTIVLTKVDIPLEYGVVIIDEKGRINKFLEKPSWGEVFSDTINTGIYIIEPEILDYIPEGRQYDFSKDLFPFLLKNNISMFGYVTNGYWCDIGSIKQYINSHLDILNGKVDLGYKKKLLNENLIIGQNVQISNDAIIKKPVIIGDNTIIKDGAIIGPYSIIGKGNLIEEGSSIKNSILWDDVILGNNCEIRGSVICKGSKLYNNVRIYENAVIGENTTLGAFSEVKPGVRIWPEKNIEEKAVITENIIWGNGKTKAVFGERGIEGIIGESLNSQYMVEIGEVFGNIFPGSCVVGNDGSILAQFAANLLFFGVISAGNEGLYADKTFLPAIRYVIKKEKLNGGIYVEEIRPGEIRIIFIDANGCDIDVSIEKKIENKLLVHDYKKADYRNLKTYKRVYVTEDYIKYLTDKKQKTSIMVKPYDKVTEKIFNDLKNYLSFDIAKEKFDVGVSIAKNGEYIILYDEKGEILTEDEINYISMLLKKKESKNDFVLPFNSSKVLSEFAKEFDFGVITSKISYKDRMKKIIDLEGISFDKTAQFNLNFDGINFLLRLLDYLEINKYRLSQIRSKVPVRYKISKIINCEWKDKGKIIKTLFQNGNKEKMEFADGIKFHHEDGFAIVIPDSKLPACKIFVEADNKVSAQNLYRRYEKMIQNILNNKEV